MPVFYRPFLPLLFCAAALLFASCDSSLDVDAGARKEIPLDPPDGAARVIPDSLEFELYLKNGWDDSRIKLPPSAGSVQIAIDTSSKIPVVWASVDYSVDGTVFNKDSSTRLLLQRIRLRADSITADRLYELSGSPDRGNGTDVNLVRYNNDVLIDTLNAVPPSQPAQMQSYATLALASASHSVPGVKKITGVYTFSATLYDITSQQVITIPLEGLVSIYYR